MFVQVRTTRSQTAPANGLMARLRPCYGPCSIVHSRFPDSWDTALPWILFAYREVPVETVGFSPFELMFGRTVSGPLLLIKFAWLQETDLSTAKQTVVEFMLSTREQLRHCVRCCERTSYPGKVES